jgi:N-acetylglutamate synthase-like GNAT family acetyltransferase
VQIRKARPSDALAVQALYRILVPDDQNINVKPERIQELQDGPSSRLLVADVGDKVRGTAFLTICLDPMYGFHPYGVVENVIVDPSVRGQGVGRALMIAIEDEARSARCTKLMLLSSVSRIEAHKFFSAIGFDAEKKRGFVKYLGRTLPLR